jgi:hypothetical protein
MSKLKEMTVVVKTVTYETFVLSEEHGSDMPVGTEATIDFVEAVKREACNGDYQDPVEVETENEIFSVSFKDED